MEGVKNLFIKLFLSVCRPLIKPHKGERFLIVSTTGLGDTLWGTPAIRALRKAYPQAYIGVLTSKMGKEVLQNNPHINEFFSFSGNLIKLFLELKKRKIAKIFIFHTSQRAVLPLCALLGAERIVGTAGINKGLDDLLTDCLPQSKIHEIERRLQIVGQATNDAAMELFPSEKDRQKAAQIAPHQSMIGIHPGAKDRFKQWAPAHFIELGKRLQKHGQIVVTGTPAEKELVEMIARAIEGAIPLYEGVSIPTLAAVLERLSLYISNDTGPMHIAAAMKTPTVALFTPTDPALCGPYHASHLKVIQKKPTCFPCLKKKCLDPFCMLQIGPDEVYQTALTQLKR